MEIKEKLQMNGAEFIENGPITIAAFGDSITQGCLLKCNDYENVYWNVLKKKLNEFRDAIPISVINAGIGGTTALQGTRRMERDVFRHCPDLIIVCFGLNDINGTLEEYLTSLEKIFREIKRKDTDAIFLTPNMLNTYVAEDTLPEHLNYARVTAQYQNEGKMDWYMGAAVSLAEKMDIKVCDCYSQWKELYHQGTDTTQLLINRINHPNREMHAVFADSLYEMIMR